MSAKRRAFKLLAVFLGVLPLLLLELGLRLFGVGADAAVDPLSGFNSRTPLFEREGAYYHTAKAREPFLPEQQFPVKKLKGTFRAFCFGGSTVHGHPYKSETAFPKWLELELSARVFNQKIEVINCGGVSYASYRIAPLVKETMNYQPDLIIVATGENEFLEDRTYHSLKTRSRLRRWLEDGLQSFRIVVVARDWVHRRSSTDSPHHLDAYNQNATAESGAEIQTKLDSPAGYASYHRDDHWHDQVAEQFEDSLRNMVKTCKEGRIPLMLIKLGCNLRDCPPYKSEHRAKNDGTNGRDEQEWQKNFDLGEQAEAKHPEEALAEYKKAEQIDAGYALLLFRIGRLLDGRGKQGSALEHYLRARDEDICPLRMPTRHEEILSRVAGENGIPLIDAASIIAGQSMEKIPGNDWYLDHVHPNIGGHQLIAQALAERVIKAGVERNAKVWSEPERQKAYKAYMDSLPRSYFAEGLKRVEWLEHWARRERLYDEASPRDGAGFLRAGFRHLELADEETARKEIGEALRRDPSLKAAVEKLGMLLMKEGRSGAAEVMESLQRIYFQRPGKGVGTGIDPEH